MLNQPTLQRFGALQGLHYGANSGPTVVFLHGYGANAYDLYSLASYLDPKGRWRWYFLDGIREAAGVPMGRAWFPIDMAALDRALRSGEPRIFRNVYPDGIERARKAVESTIAELKLEPGKTLLGGFSQGAMLATDIILQSQSVYRGLAILSGSFLKENLWNPLIEKKKDFRFFQSHGQNDPLLPFTEAEALFEKLTASGWLGELQEFRGGHEIPPQVLTRLGQFLQNQL